MAAAGSAQTPATTLHLVSTSQKGVGFLPKGAPHQGDRIGFGDTDHRRRHRHRPRRVHRHRRGRSPVHVQVQLSKGTLSVQGLLPAALAQHPVAITGGTGAYNGARGTALGDRHGRRPDIDVTLPDPGPRPGAPAPPGSCLLSQHALRNNALGARPPAVVEPLDAQRAQHGALHRRVLGGVRPVEAHRLAQRDRRVGDEARGAAMVLRHRVQHVAGG